MLDAEACTAHHPEFSFQSDEHRFNKQNRTRLVLPSFRFVIALSRNDTRAVMPNRNTTRQRDGGARDRIRHWFKRENHSAHLQHSSDQPSSQGRNSMLSSLSSLSGLPSIPSVSLTPIISSPLQGPLNQGSTSNAPIRHRLPLLSTDGPAQHVLLDFSRLSIEGSSESRVHTEAISSIPLDLSSPGSTANCRPLVEASHRSNNNSNPSASTDSTFHIKTTQSSRKTLWDQALDSLSPNEKNSIPLPATIVISSHTDFQTILTAVQEKKTKCEEERWRFIFNGHEYILCDVADKVYTWLDRFKQIGDIAVSVDPLHAGLPWAGIRLLLQVRQCSFIVVLEYE